mgnify:FL=1
MKNSKYLALRDIFIDNLYNLAKKNPKIILITNDQGAPALDKFKKDLTKQFFNMGISEQNIIAVASGLSSQGFIPFVYSISSFLIYRSIEFLKIDLSYSKNPVHLFGVGSGYSYAEDGPTHHATEDLANVLSFPNFEVFNPSFPSLCNKLPNILLKKKYPTYTRLDRQSFKDTDLNLSKFIKDGFYLFKKKRDSSNCIISTGITTQNMMNYKSQVKYDLIDIFSLNSFNQRKLINLLKSYRNIVIAEEHNKFNGLGVYILSMINDSNIKSKIKVIGLNKKNIFGYGSRQMLHKNNKIDQANIVKFFK